MMVDKLATGSQTLRISEDSMKSTTVVESSEIRTDNKYEQEQSEKQNSMINNKDLEMAVSKMNDFLEPLRRNVKFELHDKLNKYYVTVIDSSTKEIIKEIPPKKMLDMYAEMADFMGFLIDKKI
ncbi:flagellar protein FlaG [Oceanobacillus sp. CF4.6]|uniref:flagellar protein FlaG n=1 Tax=Oceanobacillus sp. CF4.6 TaxID=3373080 RepID=UPI003EE61E42